MSIKNNGLNDQVFKKISDIDENMPFQKFIGYNLSEVGAGYAIARIDLQPKHLNSIHIAHGGLLFTLLDGVMGTAAMTFGNDCVTLEMKINYIKSGKPGSTLDAVGKILHKGKKTIVAEGKITDEAKKLIACATGTYFVI